MTRFPLVLMLGMATVAAARDKTAARDWREGTVQFVEVKHTRHLEPLSPITGLEIATDGNLIYRVAVLPGIHKKDMIPFAGIVTEERRRSKTAWTVAVGAKVRFAISKNKGWILDDQGHERPLSIKSVRTANSH